MTKSKYNPCIVSFSIKYIWIQYYSAVSRNTMTSSVDQQEIMSLLEPNLLCQKIRNIQNTKKQKCSFHIIQKWNRHWRKQMKIHIFDNTFIETFAPLPPLLILWAFCSTFQISHILINLNPIVFINYNQPFQWVYLHSIISNTYQFSLIWQKRLLPIQCKQ